MIQTKLKLKSDLGLALKTCDEVWIAAALISENGFNFIQKKISNKQK